MTEKKKQDFTAGFADDSTHSGSVPGVSIYLDMVKLLMSIAAVVWFIVTPFWMSKKRSA